MKQFLRNIKHIQDRIDKIVFKQVFELSFFEAMVGQKCMHSRNFLISEAKMRPFLYHSLNCLEKLDMEGKMSSKVSAVLGFLLAATVLFASDVAAANSVETAKASGHGVHPFKLLLYTEQMMR